MVSIGGIIGGIIGVVIIATLVYGVFQYKLSRRPFTHVPKNSKFLDPENNAGIRSGLHERNVPTTHGVPTVIDDSAYPQQQNMETHPAYAPPYESSNIQTPYATQPANDLQRPVPAHGSESALNRGLATDTSAYDDVKESASFRDSHRI